MLKCLEPVSFRQCHTTTSTYASTDAHVGLRNASANSLLFHLGGLFFLTFYLSISPFTSPPHLTAQQILPQKEPPTQALHKPFLSTSHKYRFNSHRLATKLNTPSIRPKASTSDKSTCPAWIDQVPVFRPLFAPQRYCRV